MCHGDYWVYQMEIFIGILNNEIAKLSGISDVDSDQWMWEKCIKQENICWKMKCQSVYETPNPLKKPY